MEDVIPRIELLSEDQLFLEDIDEYFYY